MSETSIVKPTTPSIRISSMDQQRVIRVGTSRTGRQIPRVQLKQDDQIVSNRRPLDVVMGGGGARVLQAPGGIQRARAVASDQSSAAAVAGIVEPVLAPAIVAEPPLTRDQAQFCQYLLDRYLHETSPAPSAEVAAIIQGASEGLAKMLREPTA